MIQAFRIIEISKYDDGGQLTTRGQLMQGSSSGGGPIYARVPIQAHPQFSWRFIIFHREDVYHIIDNHQMDHLLL